MTQQCSLILQRKHLFKTYNRSRLNLCNSNKLNKQIRKASNLSIFNCKLCLNSYLQPSSITRFKVQCQHQCPCRLWLHRLAQVNSIKQFSGVQWSEWVLVWSVHCLHISEVQSITHLCLAHKAFKLRCILWQSNLSRCPSTLWMETQDFDLLHSQLLSKKRN